MKVIDASVIIDLLVGTLEFTQIGDDELAVPHLSDSEVLNALRGLVRSGMLTTAQGDAAFNGFVSLTLTRYPADWLRTRVWELRHNVSAYDATYVALAEALGATALVTTDARLARAPGVSCAVEVLQ